MDKPFAVGIGRGDEKKHGERALPLEVGGALRFRLEAKGRFEIVDCRLGI